MSGMMVDRSLEVLGVTLVGPAPLGRVHFRLEQQAHLWVLYGLNGVGKTVLLEALEDALTCRATVDWDGVARCHRLVHVRVHGDLEKMGGLGRLFSGAAGRIVSAVAGSQRDADPAERLRAGLREEYGDGGTAVVNLEDEVLAQRVFTLEAHAEHRDVPGSWRVYLAAQCDGTTPALRSLLGANAGWLDVPNMNDADDFSMGADFERSKPSRWPLERRGDPAPPWVPAPLVGFGTTRLQLCSVLSGDSLDVVGMVERLAGEACRSPDESYDDIPDPPPAVVIRSDGDVVCLAPEALAVVEGLVHDANRRLRLLLPDPPELRCVPGPPYAWPSVPPRWDALDHQSKRWVPLEALSTTQQRWARFAIGLAGESPTSSGRGPPVLLIDEPELGLHPSAAAGLAAGLERLARDEGVNVVVATHSPAFLNLPEARLLHVQRAANNDGLATIRDITGADLDPLAHQLGLGRADLLQSYRTFLLVEGEHDLAVLEAVLGDELARLRTWLAPIRGATKAASVADARFLIDFSSARILVAFDNDRRGRFEAAFDAAKAAAGRGGRPVDAFDGAFGAKPTDEERYLRELAVRALETGCHDRIAAFGFSKPDILEYLPPSPFKRGATTWEVLHAESGEKTGTAFKRWLEKGGADLSPAAIGEIARRLDHIPEDFTALLKRLE
jgi:ABC-type transport system involved in cytochrome c biogenesis ATPase subunit